MIEVWSFAMPKTVIKCFLLYFCTMLHLMILETNIPLIETGFTYFRHIFGRARAFCVGFRLLAIFWRIRFFPFFLLWDSLYLHISVEDRDYPRNGPVLEYHGYWRQGCNTRMATWGGNGVSRLQTRLPRSIAKILFQRQNCDCCIRCGDNAAPR